MNLNINIYNKIKKLSIFVCIGLIAIFCFLSSLIVFGAETEILKVGFPNFKGFSEAHEDGTYSGYTYEYLQEVAKYTGWEYEFVEGKVEELIEMLDKGEIDILGGILYDEQTAAKYDFPEYSSGATYSTLSVLSENKKYSQTDYKTFDGMIVGVLKTSKKRILNFESFCKINAIDAELKYYDSEEEQIEALKNNTVDAILGNDLRVFEDTRIIAKFAANPYYFATTKGNYKIIRKLNAAIAKINEVNLHFDAELYDKYFKQESDYIAVFSDEEKNYIDKVKTLKVVSVPGFGPIQYYDEQTGEFSGVTADMFNLISEKTGLKFEFIKTQTYEQSLEMISSGKADIIASILDDYSLSNKYNVTLTESYLSMNTVMIKNNSMNIEDISSKKLALPYGYDFKQVIKSENILYFDTFEECIKAVDSGKADYSYANSYLVEYYTRNRHYNNISLVTLAESAENICIGLSKPSNTNLVTIINKMINSISDTEFQVIIYKNTMLNNKKITLSSFIYSNPKECIFLILFVGIIIITVIIFIMRMQIKHSKQIALDGERYHILSDIADEFIFEYDFYSDILMFSEKFSKIFGYKKVMPKYYQTIKNGGSFLIDEREAILDAFDDIKNFKNSVLEFQCKNMSGNLEWYRSICTIIRDDQNNPIRAIGKLVSIENEKKEKEFLLEKSQKDSLTGIFNRCTCEEEIKSYLKNNEGSVSGALMIIDLDYFKSINDCFGHKKGDDVLKDLALTLKMIFRQTDVIGRWGGDEFIVFMKNTRDRKIVSEKASILCRIMDKTVEFQEDVLPISVSVGIAMINDDEIFSDLFQKADEALYEVKKNGKNNYKLI